jgi:hypothetical protein
MGRWKTNRQNIQVIDKFNYLGVMGEKTQEIGIHRKR